MVWLKVLRIGFDYIGQKYSQYSITTEVVCFSFHVGLLFYQHANSILGSFEHFSQM